MIFSNNFDVIVVGGGHAGAETAFAAANIEAKTQFLLSNLIVSVKCHVTLQ